MTNIIITNNKYVADKFKDKFNIEYFDNKDYMEILEYVRNKVHSGHELLTHPLSGSIKPNETPYKSIIVSETTGSLDESGLRIIEESILTARKFTVDKRTPNWTESILDDFRVIDLSLMENVIEKLGHKWSPNPAYKERSNF